MSIDEKQEVLISRAGSYTQPSKSDCYREMLALVESYERERLKAAPHQRDTGVWNKKKKREYIKRLEQASVAGPSRKPLPLGVICVYTIIGEDSTVQYLNDGLQRLSTAMDAYHCPQEYGFNNKMEVEKILQGITVPVQYREYKSHADAALDFDLVNRGTVLEAAERHRHFLVYAGGTMNLWNAVWEKEIDKWIYRVDKILSSYCTQNKENHKTDLWANRTSLQLFAVAHGRQPQSLDNKPTLEKTVAEIFLTSTPSRVDELLDKLTAYSAEVECAWRKHTPVPGKTMAPALAKWCIGVRFINTDMSPLWWKEFYGKLIEETTGVASLEFKQNNVKKRLSLAARLKHFVQVCRILGIVIPIKEVRPKATGIKLGFEDHHTASFIDNGHGDTIPVPALLNAAINARTTKPVPLKLGDDSGEDPAF